MPALATKIVATTTTEVKLRPSTMTKLRREFRTYQELKTQRDAIDLAMQKSKSVIGAIRDETGESSIMLDGFTTTLVAGLRRKLNHKKLIALGCASTWIEEATETLPNKAYEKITCPGEKEDED